MKLSVVVPAYNEVEIIETLGEKLHAVLAERVPDSELVLVDDGSRDGTGEVMDALARRLDHVVVVHNAPNRGLGGALRSGFERARGDVVTWVPGDGQYDLAQVLDGLPLLDTHDAVFARRRARTERNRNLISTVFHGMLRALFRFDARDLCGIYLIRREVLASMPLRSEDVFLNLEVPLRFVRSGRPYGDLVLDLLPRQAGSSKVANWRTLVRNTVEVLRFRFSRDR
ncbi:MAG: glycosyltransferase family 2 protein [Acidimicrobiales bacterium]